MLELLVHNLAPIMFASLVVFMLLGYPVAFALAANGIVFALIGIELGLFGPNFLQALPSRVYSIMYNDTLLAIPFFTFMGIVLERSGMAEDLLDTIGQLFGKVRGGLAYAVVLVGALLAATTGVVAASVIAMGLISLPIMLRYGYDQRLASGVIVASGTLAQIIPPSLVLIVLADQLGRSVGDMYQGALIPGLALAGLYILFVVLLTLFRPAAAPPLPDEAITIREEDGSHGYRSLLVLLLVSIGVGYAGDVLLAPHVGPDWAEIIGVIVAIAFAYAVAVLDRLLGLRIVSRMAEQVVFVLIPPLTLIFLVLGTIFLGIATPTEGGAMGAVGALGLAWSKGRLSLATLRQALDSTTKLSAFVMFILIGSRVFALTFYGLNGHVWVEELLLALPGGEIGFLLIVNLLVFVLAFFLDFFELAFIIVPLIGPVAEKLGIDLIWFGVILAANMQTSFLTPPMGFALFYLRSVAPATPYTDRLTGRRMPPVTTTTIYRAVIPFVVLQLLMVAALLAFPGLVTHYRGTGPEVDPNTIQQLDIPSIDLEMPPIDLGPPVIQ